MRPLLKDDKLCKYMNKSYVSLNTPRILPHLTPALGLAVRGGQVQSRCLRTFELRSPPLSPIWEWG